MSIFDKFWKRDVKGSMGEEKQGEMKAPVRIKPDFAKAHNNLGNALYDKRLCITSDYAEAHYLGNTFKREWLLI